MFLVVGVFLFTLGLYGVFAGRTMLRRVIGFNILATGVFMLLIAGAYKGADVAPDPVPHAMVLTGIVVAVSTTALALTLIAMLGRDLRGGNRGRK